MEATSARMAARDRFGGFAEPAHSPLQRYIMNACDPQNFEPNLALNLEIADLINAKKGNAPREAAVSIVNYVNHRNPNVSLLALNLLDICVKNCGYPFHLQISTKEFLNELVRRFPERPPVHPSRSQMKVLELIEEWRQTICETSRYKEDLGFIRDMHRLLSYKGYVFPQIRKEDAAVLNPSDNLRSAEEMEEEERAAHSAKLQELIRRGTPHDLQEANKLMKIMAGYDNRHKTDWRAKAAEEVAKVQQKARILEEMLQSHQPGEEVKEGNVMEELGNALASAQPKIQKMCEEESDDHEAVAKLLEINDSIHRTLERYKLVRKGDIEAAAKIPKGTLGTSGAGVTKGPDNELSLIDLGGPEDSEQTSNGNGTAGPSEPAPKGNALEDDLLGLSMGEAQPGQISLGASSSTQYPQPPTIQQPSDDPFGLIGNSQPTAPPQKARAVDPMAFFNQPSAPQTPIPQQVQAPPKPADPFAALASPAVQSRTASPFQFQSSISSPPPQPAPQATPAASANDDEWQFASALPDTSNEINVINTAINVMFSVNRQSDDIILINSRVSNNQPLPVTDMTFQVAVTKGYTLQLEPQSSRSLGPNQANGITQAIRLNGVPRGRGSSIKMRWKASYLLGGAQRRDEQGEIASLGVS